MSKAVAAFDFLETAQRKTISPVVVIFGDEPFLVRESARRVRDLVLDQEDADLSFSSYDGNNANWNAIEKELGTVAMFGNGLRLVQIEQADPLLTRIRTDLEKYVQEPFRSGILLLQVKSFPATTLLYKAIEKTGLLIDCRPVTRSKLGSRLIHWAKLRHQLALGTQAAELIVDKTGDDFGLLDQELARLALLIKEGEVVSPEFVLRNVGTRRTQKVWEMLDTALNGRTGKAMELLDQLLRSGEDPIGILMQIGDRIRRFALATRLFLNAEKEGKRKPLTSFLIQAGMQDWIASRSEGTMKMIGRHRGIKLLDWYMQTELKMKGDSGAPPRLILEEFLVRISSPGMRNEVE